MTMVNVSKNDLTQRSETTFFIAVFIPPYFRSIGRDDQTIFITIIIVRLSTIPISKTKRYTTGLPNPLSFLENKDFLNENIELTENILDL